MIICYLSLATRVPISCVTSRRGGAVKNRADLYGLNAAISKSTQTSQRRKSSDLTSVQKLLHNNEDWPVAVAVLAALVEVEQVHDARHLLVAALSGLQCNERTKVSRVMVETFRMYSASRL